MIPYRGCRERIQRLQSLLGWLRKYFPLFFDIWVAELLVYSPRSLVAKIINVALTMLSNRYHHQVQS